MHPIKRIFAWLCCQRQILAALKKHFTTTNSTGFVILCLCWWVSAALILNLICHHESIFLHSFNVSETKSGWIFQFYYCTSTTIIIYHFRGLRFNKLDSSVLHLLLSFVVTLACGEMSAANIIWWSVQSRCVARACLDNVFIKCRFLWWRCIFRLCIV